MATKPNSNEEVTEVEMERVDWGRPGRARRVGDVCVAATGFALASDRQQRLPNAHF